MYGNIVSSNGLINLGMISEKEIKFEHPIYYLSLNIENECLIYVNDDPDGIYLPVAYTQPFVLKDIPIFKFKICRYGYSTKPNLNNDLPPFSFSYFGYY